METPEWWHRVKHHQIYHGISYNDWPYNLANITWDDHPKLETYEYWLRFVFVFHGYSSGISQADFMVKFLLGFSTWIARLGIVSYRLHMTGGSFAPLKNIWKSVGMMIFPSFPYIWTFPKMGVPLVILHFRLGFYTMNQPAIGVPPWLWKPPYGKIEKCSKAQTR